MAGAPFECLTALREIEGVARPTEKRKKAGINLPEAGKSRPYGKKKRKIDCYLARGK